MIERPVSGLPGRVLGRVVRSTQGARAWVLGSVALVCASMITLPLLDHRAATAQTTAAQATPSQINPVARGLPDFADLVEQVGPAVVNIRTTAKAKPARAGNEPDEDMQEFFRRYFGVPVPPRQGPRRNNPAPAPDSEEETPRGVGSGFIVSADGYVMTNAHVVDEADEVYVKLTDKREFKAKVIGADKRTDVAVLKIEAGGLPTIRTGDVARLRVGEWVIAIGSPFDLDNTVTAGIVSAKARDTGDLLPFIQTDVAINPGNSGGPLINMRGEVVGINSQIYSRSGGYMGISFAIPIDEANRVADQLRSTGRVVRGRIGVSIGEVTKDVAESVGLPKPAGALVRSVESGSPADKAGIEPGDIVTRFDGRAIEKSTDLQRIVGNTKPGTRSKLELLRLGKSRELAVTVGEFEADTSTSKRSERGEPSKPKETAATALGLTVSTLGDAQRSELKVKGGVRVDSAEGLAARAGLREGDIILSVGNTEVSDARQFDQALAKLDKGKSINLLFRRGEVAQYAIIRAPAK
jgi:serine protease Do